MLVYLQMLETPEEKSKFEDIYIQNRDMLFRVANKILNNPQDAEDAVHYAFLKLAENIRKIGEAEDPKTKGYIITIVENKAIDLYRHKQAHPQQEYMDEISGIQVAYDGQNALADCILKLPPKQRSVIILKYSYGYKNGEIAKILGTTYQNVQKLDQRAKQALKELCRKEGIEW